MRLSARIKSFFKSKEIPVNVGTSQSKNPYIYARIPHNNREQSVFPLEYRQEMLKIIYGPDCNFAENGNAGNIEPYSLVMKENEWEKFLENK